jgi:RNA polymerase sigma-70 factor (ECF subfamily)
MSDPLPDEVIELVVRCKTGDHTAWSALIRWLTPKLQPIAHREYRRSWPTNPHAPQPDDLVQDAFVALYRHLENISVLDGLLGWLTTVMRNKLHDAKKSKYSGVTLTDSLPTAHITFSAPDNAILASGAVSTALKALSKKHQQMIFCVYWLGLSVPASAALLNIPEGTAKSRLSYARKTVRAKLIRLGYN